MALRSALSDRAASPYGDFPVSSLYSKNAQRIDVGGGGDRLAANLLGTGVIERHGAQLGTRLGRGQSVEFGADELGDAEIQELRHSVRGDQDVAGLEIAMDHQVPVGILHRGADVAEQLEALGDGALVLLAVTIDANAFDVLHHQVGKAVGRGSAIDQRGDVGMVKAGEHLALQAEAAQDFLRIHAALDQLDRHLLLEFVVEARGQPHRSHASAADALLQFVGSDAMARRILLNVDAGADQSLGRAGETGRGLVEEVARRVVAREQAFDFAAQFVVAGADHPKVSRTVYFGSLQRAVKDLTNLRPSLGRQESLP